MKRLALAVIVGCGITLLAGCNDTPTGAGGSGGGGSSGLVWQMQPGIEVDSYDISMNSLAFGEGTFVAVGSGIYASIDAKTWTRRGGSSAYIRKVVWNDSLFVAVGDSGTILTSPDGTTWTHRGNVSDTVQLASLVWDGNEFLAFGRNSAFSSANGQYWVKRNTDLDFPYDYNYSLDMAWGNNRFVTYGGRYASTDGLHWEVADASRSGDNSYGHVIWAGGQFVAEHGIIKTSPDGLTWTTRNSLNAMVGMGSNICWAEGKYFIQHGQYMLSSTDGDTWTIEGAVDLSNNGSNVLCYGNGKLVAMNRYGNICTANLE